MPYQNGLEEQKVWKNNWKFWFDDEFSKVFSKRITGENNVSWKCVHFRWETGEIKANEKLINMFSNRITLSQIKIGQPIVARQLKSP